MSPRTKTVFIYSILILSSLSGSGGQQIGKASSTFPKQPSFTQQTTYPVNSFGSVGTFPASKGYSPMSGGSMVSYPMHSQYWTGQPTHFASQYPQHYQDWYPQYTPYPQQQYYQHQSYYPQQYYSQQYNPQHSLGFGNQQNGYSSYHSQYPVFDAKYWAAPNYHPVYAAPVYPHPAQMYHRPMYHPAHQVPYPYQPVGPYYNKPKMFERGFLGGTGSGLAKGLLGALFVGVVAGKVAKGK